MFDLHLTTKVSVSGQLLSRRAELEAAPPRARQHLPSHRQHAAFLTLWAQHSQPWLSSRLVRTVFYCWISFSERSVHTDRETPSLRQGIQRPEPQKKGQHLLKPRAWLRRAHSSLAELLLSVEKINQHRHEPTPTDRAQILAPLSSSSLPPQGMYVLTLPTRTLCSSNDAN